MKKALTLSGFNLSLLSAFLALQGCQPMPSPDERVCNPYGPVTQASTVCPAEDAYADASCEERGRYAPTRPTWSYNECSPCGTFDSSTPYVCTPMSCATEYTVQKGDTLWGLAQRYGTTTQALADLNGISKDARLKIGQKLMIQDGGKSYSTSSSWSASSKAITGSEYVVQNGDSLSKIAHRAGTTVQAIKQLNGLSSDTIRVGQRLNLPSGASVLSSSSSSTSSFSTNFAGGENIYTVKPGDTISKIASKVGMKSSELICLNNINDPNRLQVGQVLAINASAVGNGTTTTETIKTIRTVRNQDGVMDLFSEEDITTTTTEQGTMTTDSIIATSTDFSIDDSIFETEEEISVVPVEDEQ